MSWDSYLDNLVAQTKDATGTAHCDKASIFGLDGSAWTSDAHANSFKLTPAEKQKIGQAMNSSDFTSLQASGIHAAGIKFQFLRENEGVILGKKKDQGAITIQKSKTAVVVGHTAEGCQQGNVNKGVGVIAEYLESMNM